MKAAMFRRKRTRSEQEREDKNKLVQQLRQNTNAAQKTISMALPYSTIKENDIKMFQQVLGLLTTPELCTNLFTELEDEINKLIEQTSKKAKYKYVIDQHCADKIATIPYGTDKGLHIPVYEEICATQDNSMWALEAALLRSENEYGYNIKGAPTTIGIVNEREFLEIMQGRSIPKETTKGFTNILFHGKQSHRLQLWLVRRALEEGLISFGKNSPKKDFENLMGLISQSGVFGEIWNVLFDEVISEKVIKNDSFMLISAACLSAHLMEQDRTLPFLASINTRQYCSSVKKMYLELEKRSNVFLLGQTDVGKALEVLIQIGNDEIKKQKGRIEWPEQKNDNDKETREYNKNRIQELRIFCFSVGLSALTISDEEELGKINNKYSIDLTEIGKTINKALKDGLIECHKNKKGRYDIATHGQYYNLIQSWTGAKQDYTVVYKAEKPTGRLTQSVAHDLDYYLTKGHNFLVNEKERLRHEERMSL